ncbi:MAG: hemolysin III family protein [Hyphomicrobiales bacterium]|nr:hemolysin III family protein [Hyphomicrobiales bacterium]
MIVEYSLGERVADGCMHLLGVTASLAAAVTLMIVAGQMLPALSLVPLAVYGAGLVAMFACSAAYHLIRKGKAKELFRRLDHAAIFVMIAGTYTPFALLNMGGAWGIGLLSAVWAIALFGAAAKLFLPRAFERISLALYLAQGWAVLVTLKPLAAAVPTLALVLIVVGGVLYTLGVLFHLWRRLPYHNAIWHGFVLIAAGVHYAAILDATILV